jgi:hypothetical protein
MEAVLKAKGSATRSRPYEYLIEAGYAVVGSPASVGNQLLEMAERVGAGILVPMLQFGTMPHDMVLRNMERFAEHVLPRLNQFYRALITNRLTRLGNGRELKDYDNLIKLKHFNRRR